MPVLSPPCAPEALEQRLAALPHVRLGLWPTPLERLDRLSAAWGGPPIYAKRDDLSGLALGGNKVRNLEYRLAAAQARGCDVVIMAREQYSNNARQTAAAAARLGMRMVLLVPSERPVPLQGNRLLEELVGAEVRVIPTEDPAEIRAAVRRAVEAEIAAGHRPFDNDAERPDVYAELGYVAGALELARQCRERGLEPAAIYVAAGFSHAGLLLGLRLLGLPWPVVGATVELTTPALVPRQTAAADQVCALLGVANPLRREDLEIRDEWLGAGFQRITPEARAVMREAGRLEGLLLDPVYTAKVAACLRADVLAGRWRGAAPLVFLHTGGLPALFSMPETVVSAQ